MPSCYRETLVVRPATYRRNGKIGRINLTITKVRAHAQTISENSIIRERLLFNGMKTRSCRGVACRARSRGKSSRLWGASLRCHLPIHLGHRAAARQELRTVSQHHLGIFPAAITHDRG